MGKGTVQSEQGEGEYTVRLDYHTGRLAAAISRLTERIALYDDWISTLEAGSRTRNVAETERTAMQKRKTQLEAWKADEEADVRTVWCADYTEEITGEVGTIEVPGEPDTVIMRPGWEGNSAYDSARDGQLETVEDGTPAGVYFNLALLPAWQRRLPTHRTGTITAINESNDTASVTLDAATSSQQAIDINEQTYLSDVLIDYMNCDSGAFEVGDEVVVEFTDQQWDSPVIIGFKNHPRACEAIFVIKLTRGDGVLVTDAYNPVFRIYKSNGSQITGGHTATYNAVTQYWTVELDDWETDKDTTGYWLEYQCDGANLWVQYPEIYIDSQRKNVDDLIHHGPTPREDYCHFFYTDTGSWGTYASESDPVFDSVVLDGGSDVDFWFHHTVGYWDGTLSPLMRNHRIGYPQYDGDWLTFAETAALSIDVKSSVPYYVKRWIRYDQDAEWSHPIAHYDDGYRHSRWDAAPGYEYHCECTDFGDSSRDFTGTEDGNRYSGANPVAVTLSGGTFTALLEASSDNYSQSVVDQQEASPATTTESLTAEYFGPSSMVFDCTEGVGGVMGTYTCVSMRITPEYHYYADPSSSWFDLVGIQVEYDPSELNDL